MSPITPICVRVSIAFSTDSGNAMLTICSDGTASPYSSSMRSQTFKRSARRACRLYLASQVERADLRFAQQMRERRSDHRAQQLAPPPRPRRSPSVPHQLAQQRFGVDGVQREVAERTQANRPELGVAQHDRIGRAPLEIGQRARRDEVDLGLERALKS